MAGRNPFNSDFTPEEKEKTRNQHTTNPPPSERKSPITNPFTPHSFRSDYVSHPEEGQGLSSVTQYFPPAAGLYDEEGEENSIDIFDQPFQYLHLFSKEELIVLEQQHNKSSEDLDCLMHEHQGWYRFFLADTVFAIGTEIAATPFQMVTSRDGLQAGIKLIHSDAQLSNSLSLSLGAPFVLAAMAYKIASASARQEAIKRTLQYVLSDSYENQWQRLAYNMQENPWQTTGHLVQWGFHQTVRHTQGFLLGTASILAFYEPVEFSLPFTGSISIPAWLPELPMGIQVGICAGLAYSGHRYSSLFLSQDYQQNFQDFVYQGLLDLWQNNPEGEPWLIGELFRGNFSTPLQVSLGGLTSTLFTRAYPYFYCIAETAFKKLGGLDPATSAQLAIGTTVLVGWHFFCAEYPRSYRRAMADHIKIDALLRQNLEKSLGGALNSLIDARMENLNFPLTETELDKHKQILKEQLLSEFVAAERRLQKTVIVQSEKDDFVFQQNPHLKYEIAGQTLAGLYLGRTVVAPLLLQYADAPLTVNLLCMVGLSSLLALTCYQAEKQRTINHLVRKKIDPEMQSESSSSAERPPIGALIIASHVSRALSVLGTSKRTVGGGSLALPTTVFLLAENIMELLRVTAKKTQSLIALWPWSRKQELASLSGTAGTFFNSRSTQAHKSMKAPAVAPQADWTSWLPNPWRK